MAERRNQTPSTRTLLVFPPVWTPVTPYLALPLLTAYLREQGFSVVQWDASLDFFANHLLLPDALSNLSDRIAERERMGRYEQAPPEVAASLAEIRRRPAEWRERISRVRSFVEDLRSESAFYEPERAIRAQRALYSLLRLASAAYYPLSFTFNTCTNPAVSDLSLMLRFCDDRERNPFIEFYERALPQRIESVRPGLIGVSVSTSHQLLGALTLTRFVKKYHPRIHVALGGRQAQRLQEFFAREPVFASKFCHALVPDKGERPLKRLIETLETRGSLSGVPGVALFDGESMTFGGEGSHEPIAALPAPDFSDLPLREYFAPSPILPLRLSEGCYWGKCTFCSRYENRAFQTMAPSRAAEQMETLQRRHGASFFTVNDDCLTPPYLEAFAREIIDRGLKVAISLWCKPVGSFTRERLQLLSRAGVKLIRWGIETGHPRILKLMNKGTRLNETARVLKDASEAGIWNHGTIIFGFPSETEEEAEETLLFLERNGDAVHSSIFFRFVLLNRSYILRHPEEFGIRSISDKPGLFSYDRRYLCDAGMDEQTLDAFLARAQRYRVREMYGNPFWYALRIREYLLPYVSRFGKDAVWRWKVGPEDRSVYTAGSRLTFHFQPPESVPPETLEKIYNVVASSGEVGTSWVRDNLKRAFIIGYVSEEGRVVGTMSLKRPKGRYVRKIEEKSGLDLKGYLERGYGSVRPEYRGTGIGDRLIKGLVSRAPGEKLYVLIRMDNPAPVRLAIKNDTRLAATYHNEQTGHEIGVFVKD